MIAVAVIYGISYSPSIFFLFNDIAYVLQETPSAGESSAEDETSVVDAVYKNPSSKFQARWLMNPLMSGTFVDH